ncbi:MAG: trypsin-like peptidase domain-containing protein [Bryobacterales bacterium]
MEIACPVMSHLASALAAATFWAVAAVAQTTPSAVEPALTTREIGPPPPVADLSQISRSFEQLSLDVSPAVVQVIVSGYAPSARGDSQTVLSKQRSGGSGVIVDPEGYIITNAHVVEGAQRVQVLLASRIVAPSSQSSILKARPRPIEAKVLAVDAETDLAFLKIEESGLPSLTLSDSDSLQQGQLVFAFGSPLGLENSVTMGIVSAVARQLEPDHPMIYVQTDTAINPGNSGGPLVNTRGQVVGINTLILSQSGGNEGLGFAAPSNIVRAIYQQVRQRGEILRGEIGVRAQTITPLLAEALGLAQDWGVVAGDVAPGGPADIAGLQVGDVILSLDGKVMENGRQFQVNLYRYAIGDVVHLNVLRGQEQQAIQVAVLERTKDPERLRRLVSRAQNLIPQLGVLAIGVNRDLAKMLPPLRRPGGVIVAAIVADGPYWKAEFQTGDVIHAVNRTPVGDLPDLRKALEPLKPGDPVAVQIERDGELSFAVFQFE